MLLQEDLIQVLPMVAEANAMAEELNKGVKFEITLVSPQARGLKNGRTEVSLQLLISVEVKTSEQLNSFTCTVMTLTFQLDRSGQTVQTQIRLLLEEQSDQDIHCLLFHLHVFDKKLQVWPLCLNF